MSNSAQDWMNQWQALAQRYWDGWKSQGVTPPAGFGKLDANAPWQAALDQWSQLFGKGNSQSDVVDRVTANAKSYVSLMQSMLNSSLGQGGDGSAAAWTEALATHSPAVRSGIPMRPRMVCFGGGLPIRHEGRVIGGIGVSGGSELEDETCAKAGLSAIGLDI